MDTDRRTSLRSGDGSITLYSERFEATYHSLHGAIQESRHVFIDHGLKYKIDENTKALNIFEMGFGTGLNALLTALHIENGQSSIQYYALELYPLISDEYNQLDYCQLLNIKPSLLERLHQLPFDTWLEYNSKFRLIKMLNDLRLFRHTVSYDLIYYDAFAPGSQPELWTQDIFISLYQAMNDGAVLVTYCAKGAFKRMLKSIGFELEVLPGPPGKREMTRAYKI